MGRGIKTESGKGGIGETETGFLCLAEMQIIIACQVERSRNLEESIRQC